MRIKNRFRNSNSSKNPQSGSNNEHSSHSESQSYNSSNNDGSSNSGAIPVNLTSPPPLPSQNPVMQNWKAFTDGGGVPQSTAEIQNNGNSGGGGGRSEKSRGGGGGGVSNLILLIEQGQWNAASQRAISHPHEVRQLVKLRKTTKTGGGGAIGGSGGGDAPPLSSQAGGPSSNNSNSTTTGGGSSGGGGGSHNVQISNVKCKALHHACQKLRSVHTNIYQKKSSSSSNNNNNNDTTTTHDSSDYSPTTTGQRKSIIEEDEYIEACKCILTLIKIHPEACKERESRHGCLPLHLCVFSMCSTPPPPPMPQVVVSSSSKGGDNNNISGGKKLQQGQGHTKSFSDFFGNTFSSASSSSTSTRPPPISNRSSTASPKFSDNGLMTTSLTGNHQGSGSHTRNSSADFSVGNISTMIQEESEHQQKLDEHHRQTKSSTHDVDDNRATQDDMNRLLSSFQRDASVTTEKKSNTTSKNRQIGLGSTIGTMVMGALTPLDALEEKSRETDSYSTPQHKLHNSHHHQGHMEGSQANSTLHPLMRSSTTSPSALASIRNYVSPNSSFDNGGSGTTGGGGGGDDQSSTRSGGTSTTANSSGGSGNHGVYAQIAAATNATTTTTTHPTNSKTSGLAPPTHEELQRRYLQINTRRRDEFSIRVIDALLDAWPRGSKTASEGGRLPLHMACFGKATVRVMETILRSYPDAARQRNADGFLPIHIAAHWGVSHPDVAPLLLRAYPDGAVGRNRWERTPIEEALGMAGENGREHQMSLVWSLRRHPTYWIHNDITTMLLPRNVRNAPWRIVDMGKDVTVTRSITRISGGGGRNVSLSSAVDVDEVGSSDEDEEGIEVQMPNSPKLQNPKQIKALAESTDLSLLIARDKHWEAAALRCKLCPNEAGEALEVKVRGAYTAKITPLLFACEHNPSVELVKALIKANPASLKRRQDPGGQLPIHAACTWGASSGVIDLLLSADPSMAEEQDFLSNLPLHCACYSGAETSIIRALLRVYPQSVWPRNHQGSSAVDIVKRLSHPNRREVLGLLDMTTKNLLERKKKETKKKGDEEGVEVDKDNSLLWV